MVENLDCFAELIQKPRLVGVTGNITNELAEFQVPFVDVVHSAQLVANRFVKRLLVPEKPAFVFQKLK